MGLAWELDPRLLAKASSPQLLHGYLVPVFEQVVLPMERMIRNLMFIFRQLTESALFASDLRFHISSATTDDISSTFKYLKPDTLGGQKPDEALSILNMKLSAMVVKYRTVLRQLIDNALTTDVNAEVNLSVALYLACMPKVVDSVF